MSQLESIASLSDGAGAKVTQAVFVSSVRWMMRF
jgi:hypothetical protein